ncbi:MgtC/SapB family protein [Rhizobium leguminosarum]|uniref:MgtC/SapB family protein n=1 Tax=Rhizobium leguminosarum TaxID=384 RepID=UPI001C97A190|nr:MgtC/SapB family protein [Rhizobium leguminosarum]MBY5410883.1 MgtC/SapB family protein [Rhizobium leguminosarum]MBY5591577.1 MgtC/SapB family protein [Rhizobium leguminosarum]MBY5605413.1 MgtC/SapB family protein [Rhizobium leguminosarum]
MMTSLVLTDEFRRLSLALAIGILVGIERGWREREAAPGKRVAGIRTYGLASFLGGFCGFLQPVTGPILPTAIFTFFCITILAFSRLQAAREEDYSATGTIVAITVFALGFGAVVADMSTTAASAVAIAALLAAREPLHGFVRKLTWLELRAALILLTMTVVILPILPNETVDPWQTINPFELWMMTILVGAVSFAGYVMIRLSDTKSGILLTGASGGLVSSTALALSFARQSKQVPALSPLLSAGAMLAGAVSLTRVLLICGVIAPTVLKELAPMLGPAAAILAIGGGLAGLSRLSDNSPDFSPQNPLEVMVVLRFALLLGVVIIVTRATLIVFGTQSLAAVAFITGLGDLDAITLSVAKLAPHDLSAHSAAQAIAIAAVANLFAKAGLAASGGSIAYAARLAITSAIAVLAGAAGLLLT